MTGVKEVLTSKESVLDCATHAIHALNGRDTYAAAAGLVLAAGTIMNNGRLSEAKEDRLVEDTIAFLTMQLMEEVDGDA